MVEVVVLEEEDQQQQESESILVVWSRYLERLLLHMCTSRCGGQKGERIIHSFIHTNALWTARVCDRRVSRGRERRGKEGGYRATCWVQTEAGREGGRGERKGER